MKTLEAFRNTKIETTDLAKTLTELQPGYDTSWFDEGGPIAGYIYDGDTYMYKIDDGRIVCPLYCDEFVRPNADHLPELEIRLYEWAVTECYLGDATEFDRDEAFTISTAIAFVDDIVRAVGRREFDEICYRNATPEYAEACATHDFVDANMYMYDAYVKTCELYNVPAADHLDGAVAPMDAAWNFARANLMKPVDPRLVEDNEE